MHRGAGGGQAACGDSRDRAGTAEGAGEGAGEGVRNGASGREPTDRRAGGADSRGRCGRRSRCGPTPLVYTDDTNVSS